MRRGLIEIAEREIESIAKRAKIRKQVQINLMMKKLDNAIELPKKERTQ